MLSIVSPRFNRDGLFLLELIVPGLRTGVLVNYQCLSGGGWGVTLNVLFAEGNYTAMPFDFIYFFY